MKVININVYFGHFKRSGITRGADLATVSKEKLQVIVHMIDAFTIVTWVYFS